jgi:D-glycero-D-manno-heptose 1,7-bisphosphate phosphatase
VSARRAVFLDRDGVINGLVADPLTGLPESPLRASDVVLLDGVAAAMCALASAGFVLVGVSNQPAAAKQTVPMADLMAVQERVVALLAEAGAAFDDFRICWHHPDGTDPLLGTRCDCRKPAPGMLHDAARANGIDLSTSWTIGDGDSDVIAGAAAGTQTVLIEQPASAHKRAGAGAPTLVAADLPEAVAVLVDMTSR